MLVAKCEDVLIEASLAKKGNVYVCPSPACNKPLVLKQGRIVAAHFAHKPPFNCEWGAGETAEHRLAKRLFHDAFTARGLPVELECYAPFADGSKRRADLLVMSPTGVPVAFEFQKTSISLPEIEQRAAAYARHGHAQIWLPIARPDFWKAAKQTGGHGWKTERYTPGEFEKWISGLYKGKDYWMFDPQTRKVLICHQEKTDLYREGFSGFQEGEERFSDGYYYKSKRFRTLRFTGPFDPSDFRIRLSKREAFKSGKYHWPAGLLAQLVRIEKPGGSGQ